MYVSVMYFTLLGDQDMYCATQIESIVVIIYSFLIIVMGAYTLGEWLKLSYFDFFFLKNFFWFSLIIHMTGTVTMLMVKGDERSKAFRDQTTSLHDYSKMNDLPEVCVCVCECLCLFVWYMMQLSLGGKRFTQMFHYKPPFISSRTLPTRCAST